MPGTGNTGTHRTGPAVARAQPFKVIEGGRRAQTGFAKPDPLRFSPQELAAEMAELFALGLMQDCRLDQIASPDCPVQIAPGLVVTQADVMAQVSALPWFSGQTCLAPGMSAQRRALHRQKGKLTLWRGGVALPGNGAAASAVLMQDHSAAAPAPVRHTPQPDAPMSVWADWCARQFGAGLRLPGAEGAAPQIDTLAEMAAHIHAMPAARPFFNAALAALARGARFGGGATDWNGKRLLSTMAKAADAATRVSLLQASSIDRMSRPAVTAARLSLNLSMAQVPDALETEQLRAAAEILRQHAPQLLAWMSAANAARRGPQRTAYSLFLPLNNSDSVPLHPADCATHMLVGSALATVLKAVVDGGHQTQLTTVGSQGRDVIFANEIDQLVANIATARVVSGGYFPAENHQEQRLGQALGLAALRDTLTLRNCPAAMAFRDLDGRVLQLVAEPGADGHPLVRLLSEGTCLDWPSGKRPPKPPEHLAVV
ncbi:hypothetical protein [Tropicibacter naphthalenivorans]|uniref:Bromoperoxidase n=1 Tax=Tropicibacter naphthalenivorans TaxID=441103 RepID=A0A0P1GAY0_9RHOB|nr:hypothetical protein [Tropicibacter naphthalenivorans]CUH78595.1 hypothetical protein TRN7648_02058 [Tropicibacter naphthalenivorans]SMC81000.1 hypothetical protein SAMN04488093_104220 [Tropicibacter naphthalenivorans]